MQAEDRLQPSLLDRLTDDAPETAVEPRERRMLSFAQLKDAVRRDLAWLLNTGNLETVQDLSDWSEAVAASVINYGMPDLTGLVVSGLEVREVERALRQTILNFEPRILPKSLHVSVSVSHEAMTANAVRFEIDGELWAQPMPLRLLLRSEMDLYTGNVSIEEVGTRGSG
jgi:type VI secretion system protein ImpF